MILALPDQPSLSYDSFGLASEIRPLVGRGRRDATLLRTRYVDQRAVVRAGAFWGQSERSEDIVAA